MNTEHSYQVVVYWNNGFVYKLKGEGIFFPLFSKINFRVRNGPSYSSEDETKFSKIVGEVLPLPLLQQER